MTAIKIPENLKAGDEVEVQLAPVGEYPQIVDGKKIVQKVDLDAIKRLVSAFDDEVLVDADHSSEGGSSTEAMAWVTRLMDDPERGLVGVFKFTDKGAEAVGGRRYRFVSPAWTLNDDGHPLKLVSVGLTNKPNLPVAPVLNMRACKAGNTNGGSSAGSQTEPPKGYTHMNEIKAKLGLPAEATDEEVATAVAGLVAKCDEMKKQVDDLSQKVVANEEAQKEAEAQKFADENKDVVENADELKEQYKADPEGTAKVIANCRKAMEKAIANAKAVAPKPAIDVTKAKAPVINSIAAELAKCKTIEEQNALLVKNAQAK